MVVVRKYKEKLYEKNTRVQRKVSLIIISITIHKLFLLKMILVLWVFPITLNIIIRKWPTCKILIENLIERHETCH